MLTFKYVLLLLCNYSNLKDMQGSDALTLLFPSSIEHRNSGYSQLGRSEKTHESILYSRPSLNCHIEDGRKLQATNSWCKDILSPVSRVKAAIVPENTRRSQFVQTLLSIPASMLISSPLRLTCFFRNHTQVSPGIANIFVVSGWITSQMAAVGGVNNSVLFCTF